MTDTIYWIWLSLCCGPASRAYAPLLERFGSACGVYSASEKDLLAMPNLPEGLAARLSRKNLDAARAIADACAMLDIGIVTYENSRYPARLRQLRDAPAVLYYRGEWFDFDKNVCIAVVGTRKMSDYGLQSAFSIAAELTAGGAVVVSGMALGIDSMAAAGALDVGGRTVAVLGCGVDVFYPPEHAYLMKKIIQRGLVVSEYPPGTAPERKHFPERNRIISGLCQGTLVIEADMRSGSLITARCAAYQGREVFALPGMVGVSNSEGTNYLIKNGARIVTCAEDILELYQFLYPSKINIAAIGQIVYGNALHQSMGERAAAAAVKLRVRSANPARYKPRESKPLSPQPQRANKPEPQTAKAEKKAPTSAPAPPGAPVPPDEGSARVYARMPAGRAVTMDELAAAGFKISEVASALTLLEISGLVTALPGGQYLKN